MTGRRERRIERDGYKGRKEEVRKKDSALKNMSKSEERETVFRGEQCMTEEAAECQKEVNSLYFLII